MADAETAAEPVFRANKRRKVVRKRADSEDAGEDKEGQNGVEGGKGAKAIDSSEDREESALRTQKRAGVRKHGIAFSSTEGRRTTGEGSEEQALVPFSQDAPSDGQIDRFVRPMGREAVSEDKHMMAYVDSKLAEMRAAASPATTTKPEESIPQDAMLPNLTGDTATASTVSDERTSQSAQARGERVYQRPTKRPRKKKYERGEADIARDAYIDQFMQEAQVPIYDQSTTTKNASLDTDGDNDAATAEAFKAQLLADMAMHRRRPPKSASEKTATTSSGPKLGGSRQQRERMRAMQEAEGKK